MTAPIDVKLHIGARKLASGSGGTFEHVNAHSGDVQAAIPLAGAEEMNAAVDAASDAFEHWRRIRPSERRDMLIRLADLIGTRAADFARLISLENGTPIAISSQHGAIAREWFSYYAGWADKLTGDVSASFVHGRDFAYSLAEPYGVIAAIIPWNGPLHSIGMKAAPILAAGNTLVLKPSEWSPFSAELFAQCVEEAGIPDGVCNVMPGGIEAGQALVAHPAVQKVSFTGGAPAARAILADCARTLKPAVLELGGKSANLVFADADLDKAANHAALWSVGLLSGQGCVFPTRLLVQAEVYEEMVDRVAEVARSIPMGDPFDETMVRGPVVNHQAADRILATIRRNVDSGAGRVVAGGNRAGGPLAKGAYVQSTVFADVDPTSDLAQNEVFGPILAITKFSDEAEGIRLANATGYGLGGYLHTADLNRAHRVAEAMRAGGIFVNGAIPVEPDTPFGGRGLSGYGREGGRQGIDEFIRPKTVAISAG
ncbi:MAG: aldehyde dehydrogenase family protein [Sphingomonadales bacterium]